MPSCATRVLAPALLALAAVSCEHPGSTTAPEAGAYASGSGVIAGAGATSDAQPTASPGGGAGTAFAPAQFSSLASAGAPAAGSFAGGAGEGAPAAAPLRIPVRSPEAYGGGECSNTRLDQFIARAQEARPELRGIDLPPSGVFGGSATASAYLEPDGRFQVVFRRGDGDCVAGCIDNEYWYFDSGPGCAPEQVGYYSSIDDNAGNCFHESGMALWGEPHMRDPQYVCGADLKPQNLAGRYPLHARGVLQPCARSGEKLAPMSIDKTITLEITQDSAQPGKGTVTLHDLGHPLLDERKLPATIVRRKVSVQGPLDAAASSCPGQSQLDLVYDFEDLAGRQLRLTQVESPDCSKPEEICKGFVELGLSEI